VNGLGFLAHRPRAAVPARAPVATAMGANVAPATPALLAVMKSRRDSPPLRTSSTSRGTEFRESDSSEENRPVPID
jgi:hypothetical protein